MAGVRWVPLPWLTPAFYFLFFIFFGGEALLLNSSLLTFFGHPFSYYRLEQRTLT